MEATSGGDSGGGGSGVGDDYPPSFTSRATSGGDRGGDGSGGGENDFPPSFTSIQTRRFRPSTSFACWSPCPSMDLLALGNGRHHNHGGGDGDGDGGSGGPATSVSVRRILSWQRILDLPEEALSSAHEGGPLGLCLDRIEARHAGGGTAVDPDGGVRGATSLCWSPDGRTVAVGLADGGIALRSVEPGRQGDGETDGEGPSSSRLILPPPSGGARLPALAMAWGRLPSSLACRRAGRAEREMASARLRRDGLPMGWSDVLPRRRVEGLDYGVGGRSGGDPGTTVLCAATEREFHWYLRGRYRILTVPHGLDGRAFRGPGAPGTGLVLSPDLSALAAVAANEDDDAYALRATQMQASLVGPPAAVAHAGDSDEDDDAFTPTDNGRDPEGGKQGRESVWVYGTDVLSSRRTELSNLAGSYELLFLHLHHVTRGIEALDTGWRSALRPLETKLESLAGLLKPYSDAPGGFDTKEGRADAVRSELFRFILAGRAAGGGGPTSALDRYFTRGHMHDQLLQREASSVEGGLAGVEVKFRNGPLHSSRAAACESERLWGMARSDPDGLVDADEASELCRRARSLYLTAVRCHASVVEARRRVRDLLRWIRGTSSQVRAWGTAADGVQRRNARDRRVSGGEADRVAHMLSGPYAVGRPGKGSSTRTVAECVVGVPLTDYCAGEDAGEADGGEGADASASLAAAAASALRTAACLFDRPRSAVAGSLDRVEVRFESDHVAAAVHSRVGPGAAVSKGDGGFFVPHVEGEEAPSLDRCAHWILVARSLGGRVEVLVLPGGAADPSSSSPASPSFCLRTVLDLPDGCTARGVSFYGDSGLNSLCPADGLGDPVKERRQALCLVVDVPSTPGEGEGQTRATELWQFEYDGLPYARVGLAPSGGGDGRRVTVPPVGDGAGATSLSPGGGTGPGSLVPRRRRIDGGGSDVQMRLCGSRGTGSVISRGRSTVLEVFDMEEDDEEDEDDESRMDE